MEFIQKKGSIKHTITLYDDYFNFAYQEKSGSGDHDINYAHLPEKKSIKIEQNEWLRNVGYLWCVIGLIQLGYTFASGSSLSGKGFWLIVGLGCLAWSIYSAVKYTVYSSDQGNVFIIHDAKHDQIIEELQKRKKKQLFDWYAQINPDNSLENEINKFKWLVEQDVITKEESEKKIAQVEQLSQSDSDGIGAQLN